MTNHQESLFQRFLTPIFRLLIDGDALERVYESVDWPSAVDRLVRPNFTYPTYYEGQNFHGIQGGYLNPRAAVFYDPITQYVLPPNEPLVRQGLISVIQGTPRRVLDLGCGTGTMTLMLKRAFPEAEVIGLDLSPYMLTVAEMKAKQANLTIQFIHGNAEHSGFPSGSCDLVTAALLFHETPTPIAQAILAEAYRLLTVGGEVAILDGNQQTLRQTEWLNHVFEEPYIEAYAKSNVDAWLRTAGFGAVQTQDHWWVHQLSHGVKGLSVHRKQSARARSTSGRSDSGWEDPNGIPAPTFGVVS
ncbi:methyltransferase type 11 [Leptolyngbya sp. 'hensonii']|uniref:class I SAM-dependent methyltransferase n=1 Tax=Leptolyngbya sp. 'hensonii' TaxID=1922337 RepID=UPI00094FF72E|nr:class I SAM-dependent methyltransferase [Leptolyngbya sp. 'hensonii']OLP15604.1 methyltransferase type 11 [Leptolyngbya sp. 'hensonii']